MATNRMRRTRNRKDVIPLDDTIVQFLLFGKAEKGTSAWDLRTSRFFDGGEAIRKAWESHGKALLSLWRGPGRPWAERFIEDPHEALYGDDNTD